MNGITKKIWVASVFEEEDRVFVLNSRLLGRN